MKGRTLMIAAVVAALVYLAWKMTHGSASATKSAGVRPIDPGSPANPGGLRIWDPGLKELGDPVEDVGILSGGLGPEHPLDDWIPDAHLEESPDYNSPTFAPQEDSGTNVPIGNSGPFLRQPLQFQ